MHQFAAVCIQINQRSLLFLTVAQKHSHDSIGSRTQFHNGIRSVSRNLRSVLDTFLGIALRVRGTDLGNIQVFDQQTENLVIVTQRGFGLDFLHHFSEVNCQDDSACGRALRLQELVLIPDVEIDPLFAEHRPVAAGAGFRAVQSVPLIMPNGGLLGILSTHFRKPLHLSQETRHHLRRQQRTTDLVSASLLAPFDDRFGLVIPTKGEDWTALDMAQTNLKDGEALGEMER